MKHRETCTLTLLDARYYGPGDAVSINGSVFIVTSATATTLTIRESRWYDRIFWWFRNLYCGAWLWLLKRGILTKMAEIDEYNSADETTGAEKRKPSFGASVYLRLGDRSQRTGRPSGCESA